MAGHDGAALAHQIRLHQEHGHLVVILAFQAARIENRGDGVGVLGVDLLIGLALDWRAHRVADGAGQDAAANFLFQQRLAGFTGLGQAFGRG